MFRLLALFLLLASGCARPPRDKNGNRPRDIARAFLDAVQRGDRTTVTNYWSTGSIEYLEEHEGKSFREACDDLFECDSYELKRTFAVPPYFVVPFLGSVKAGPPKAWPFMCAMEAGEWKLHHQPSPP